VIASGFAVVPKIAGAVFRESVRDKILYGIVAFAVLIIAASLLLGQLTAGQEVKIIKDLGLAAISIFGHFIAIFIGIGLVSKEVERRSIYALLVKPMTRSQLLLGKYLGLVLTLAVNVTVMTAALLVVLAIYVQFTPPQAHLAWDAPGVDPALIKASALMLVELSFVTALAIFFSTFTSPVLAAGFTLGLTIAGHFSADLRNLEMVVSSDAVKWLTRSLYYLLPNLAPFDVKLLVVHGRPVTPEYMLLTTGYGLVYITALIMLSSFVFSRRDFK
jgi:Cu-processing system permease protein